MNIETANKLVELRKKNNLSQEELASKLGISRQAISKWERAEAAPDTDNLIKLARLYKISLDDLLLSDIELMNEVDKKLEDDKVASNEEEISIDEDGIRIIKGYRKIFVSKKNVNFLVEDKRSKNNNIYRTIRIIIPNLCIIGLFLFGFLTLQWNIAWLFLLGIPLLDSVVNCCYYKRIRYFNYLIFVIIIFFILGFTLSLWVYAWVLFLTVPIFYALFGGYKRIIYIK